MNIMCVSGSNLNGNRTLSQTKPSFKGFLGCEPIRQKNVKQVVNHYTYYFRECAAFEFLKQFIRGLNDQKALKPPFKIVGGACSTGDEIYTNAMILDELGELCKNIHILGFDISRSTVQKAKNASCEIRQYQPEADSFLHSAVRENPKLSKYKELFHKFFERDPAASSDGQRGSEAYKRSQIPFKIGKLTFRQGDIFKLDKLIKDGEADTFLFRNAFYHFTHKSTDDYGRMEPIQGAEETIQNIIKDIHRKLSNRGLFIVSPLEYMRCAGAYTKNIPEIIQNEGFRPLFKEPLLSGKHEAVTVWQKE